jgi:hypothetical protein
MSSFDAFFNKRLSPSIIRMKRRGNSGKPWRTPLSLLKKPVGSPFTKKEKDEDVTHAIIQFVI